jgi:purine nucleosidase/pyrimidine-specific ribonucleoside hydrolase
MEASQSNFRRHAVLIDTDIGDDIDDALALALALRSPEMDVRAVTTVFGDTHLRARLAAHILRVFGREDIQIAAGQHMPLLPRHRPSGVPLAAMLDTCTKSPELSPYSGPELIIQTAMVHHGNLTLLCLGPLTNVATALMIEPRLFMAIRGVIFMGGTSGFPVPEWNVRSDAQAAKIVLASGVPVALLGWNVTRRCQFRESDIEKLQYENSPQTCLLSLLIAIWQRHRPRWHPKLPYLHDPLAIVALCASELFQFEAMTARVFTRGLMEGFMLSRRIDGPLVQAATDVQPMEAREWMMRRLLEDL